MYLELKEKLIKQLDLIDNEYLNKYIELIVQNRTTVKQPNKTQIHHIIPRYFYQKNNLAIDNTPNNLVNLLYKDHILAHYCLMNCSKNEFKYLNAYALRLLNPRKCEDLETAQKIYEESKQNYVITDETRQKIKIANSDRCGEKNPMYGHKLSQEHIAKIKEANTGENNKLYGKHLTDECKRKKSLAMRGKKPANSKKVKCVETQQIFASMLDANAWLKSIGRKGSVKDVIAGRLKTAGQYHWEIVKEEK